MQRLFLIDYLCWAPVGKEIFNMLIHTINDEYFIPFHNALSRKMRIKNYLIGMTLTFSYQRI